MERLERALKIARAFKPLENEELSAPLATTKDFGLSGEGGPIKTATRYDNRPSETPSPCEALTPATREPGHQRRRAAVSYLTARSRSCTESG